MKPVFRLLSLLLLLALALAPAGVAAATPQESPSPQSTTLAPPCNTPEVVNSGEIATFRDNYAPVEYAAESALWRLGDVAMLALLLAAGIFLFVRNRPPREATWLAAVGLFYFGIVRGGCICPVGTIGNMVLGIRHPEMTGLYVGLLFFLPLVAAFFVGRVFCTSACPLGAVQHLFQRKKSVRLPGVILVLVGFGPPLVLLATAWSASSEGPFLTCMLDPYKTLFFAGNAVTNQACAILSSGFSESGLVWAGGAAAWMILTAVLLLGYWVPRPFCRGVCPYGVILGLISSVAVKRYVHVAHQSTCSACCHCVRVCPVQAIAMEKTTGKPRISNYACVRCGRCAAACTRKSVPKK
jgi:ferredoxin-type protein NapH